VSFLWNTRYLKVLAARLVTKGWAWRSWGVGDFVEKRKYSGGKNGLAQAVEGGRSLLFGFSKRTHLAKSDPVSQICKLNLTQFYFRPE
jgi:hypothetical protein